MFFILSSATQNTSQKRTGMKINKYNKCLLIIVKVKWMFKKFNIKNIGGIHKFLFVFITQLPFQNKKFQYDFVII